MTEQEFRELTAYQPPSQPKHNPPVSSIATAVAAGNAPVPPIPPIPHMPDAHQGAPIGAPPSPPLFPVPPDVADHSTQNQFISQIHQQPTAPPVHEAVPIPPAPAPVPAPPTQMTAPAPAAEPHKGTSDLVPQEKHNELMEQYARLVERYKHLVEERDALSRQVAELKHALSEHGESGAGGRDYKEEIRLLGKLIEDEQSLRKAVVDSGAYKPGDDPYARHDKLVNVFLNIVART